MDFDLEKAIMAIDRKIESLEQAKQVLVELFGDNSIKTSSRFQATVPTAPKLPVRRAHLPKPPTPPVTRKQQVIELLSKEGPLGRTEIHNKTGIPEGSIAMVLNDKNTFKSIEGKWHVIELKADD